MRPILNYMKSNDFPVQSVYVSFQILSIIKEKRSVGVSKVADKVGISKGAVHQHLKTLRMLGYLENDNGKYSLSPKFLSFGSASVENYDFYDTAVREVNKLSRSCRERAALAVKDGENSIYVYRTHYNEVAPLKYPPLGEPFSLSATTGGRAILAALPKDDREITADNNDYQNTINKQNHGNTDIILDYDDDEHRNAIAGAIKDKNGDPIGAISVIGSSDELSGRRLEENVTGMLLNTIQSIQSSI